ncbi:hypothetical protein MMC06_003764, partial [Schaereria dolodes]|nr:hypothetical protein [Schaereria dolodes]
MELHETRHREIATIVQRIQLLDETAGASITGPLHGKKRKPKKNDVLELYEVDFDRACDVEETNGGMEASTICEEESDMKRPRMSDTQEVKNDNKKAKKAEKRMVKNRARIKVITAEEVRRIREALHPTHEQSGTENTGAMRYVNDGLLNNSTINNNIAFNTNTFSYGSLRQQVHIKKLSKARGISPTLSNSTSQDSSALPLILCRLGLSVTKMVCSKDRKAFMSKLKEAIQSDLVTTENEERDTMKRMAGYWRYVNKRTYNCMVRNNELWDWRTGAKLEEIEEEDEEEGSQLENQEVAVTDAVAGDEVEKYDDDFVLGPGALKLANRDS